jgi:DNA-directed RNA polymerase subunit M/transcription elongation factor TFIIS
MKVTVVRNKIFDAFKVILNDLSQEKRGDKTAQNFVDLKLADGNPLFGTDEKSISEIHEVAAMMHKLPKGAEQAYYYLSQTVIPIRNELLETNQKETYSTIIFMSPLLEQHRKREEAVLALLEDKGPLTDAASCPKCGEPKVHRRLAQTRSADEGTTSIFTCPRCAFPWTDN